MCTLGDGMVDFEPWLHPAVMVCFEMSVKYLRISVLLCNLETAEQAEVVMNVVTRKEES